LERARGAPRETRNRKRVRGSRKVVSDASPAESHKRKRASTGLVKAKTVTGGQALKLQSRMQPQGCVRDCKKSASTVQGKKRSGSGREGSQGTASRTEAVAHENVRQRWRTASSGVSNGAGQR